MGTSLLDNSRKQPFLSSGFTEYSVSLLPMECDSVKQGEKNRIPM